MVRYLCLLHNGCVRHALVEPARAQPFLAGQHHTPARVAPPAPRSPAGMPASSAAETLCAAAPRPPGRSGPPTAARFPPAACAVSRTQWNTYFSSVAARASACRTALCRLSSSTALAAAGPMLWACRQSPTCILPVRRGVTGGRSYGLGKAGVAQLQRKSGACKSSGARRSTLREALWQQAQARESLAQALSCPVRRHGRQ